MSMFKQFYKTCTYSNTPPSGSGSGWETKTPLENLVNTHFTFCV